MNIDISKFDQTHLLVIGDLMIDEYVWGEVGPRATRAIRPERAEDQEAEHLDAAPAPVSQRPG